MLSAHPRAVHFAGRCLFVSLRIIKGGNHHTVKLESGLLLYGTEADQYSFYRIPKTLLADPRYKSVSIKAKVLYGLLLDRMGLSIKNGWIDSDRCVYIYFTQENAMNLMSCGKDKATKLFRELVKDGIGLIDRKKQGQGRPTRIYVKNFILPRSSASPSNRNRHHRLSPLRRRKIRSLHRWKCAVKTAVFPPLIKLGKTNLI